MEPEVPRAVTELRLAVTVEDYDAALAFYRDSLGLPVKAVFDSENGRATLLDAGRATIEIFDAAQAEYVDRLEVGRRVAGHIRVAFEVEDTARRLEELVDGGATVLGPPRPTPWGSLNARLDAPGGLQLTLFSGEPDT